MSNEKKIGQTPEQTDGSVLIWKTYLPFLLHGFDPQSANFVDYIEQNNRYIKEHQSVQAAVAVVIPAYNEAHRIGRALASLNHLLSKNPHPVNICVVDNNSSDATGEIAKQFGIQVIDEKTQGIAVAREAGLLATDPKNISILTTDADSAVPENWIKAHLEVLMIENVVFSGGPVSYMVDQKLGWLDFKLASMYCRARDIIHTVSGEKTKGYFFGGANSAYNREAAMQVGGYDTTLASGEDLRISQALAEIGEIRVAHTTTITSARRVLHSGLWSRVKLSLGHRLYRQLKVGKIEKPDFYAPYANIRPENDNE